MHWNLPFTAHSFGECVFLFQCRETDWMTEALWWLLQRTHRPHVKMALEPGDSCLQDAEGAEDAEDRRQPGSGPVDCRCHQLRLHSLRVCFSGRLFEIPNAPLHLCTGER